jgi:phage shock protein PspC (stress-responsive transcriptional regulator)
MGPIDATAGDAASGGEAGGGAATAASSGPRAKRLYRIPQGAMVAGVCTGLAAYFGVDVTFIRIGFALVAVLTQGVGILAYVVMMFVMPEARTPEERAAAGGAPFNAREVIDRATKQYAEGTRQVRRQWRQQQRQWRRYAAETPIAYGPPSGLVVLLPVFALVHLALFLALAAMVISLVNTGAILHWPLPEDVPVWAGVLILLVSYQIVVSPFRAAHQWAWRAPTGQPGVYAFWHAVVWLLGLGFALWLASGHIPEIREFLQRLPELFQEFARSMRNLTER